MDSNHSPRGAACNLPEELVVEVLRRLPHKSLCRFRCVSKSWLALTSHPHHRRHKLPQDLAGLLYTNHHGDSAVRFALAGSSAFPGLRFLPCASRALPVDCCNGLLLCRSADQGTHCSYYVCNPATGKWTALPEPGSGFQALALAYSPCGASPRFHVLSFARTEAMYRAFLDDDEEEELDEGAVELSNLYEEGRWLVEGLEVFSSETGKWAASNVAWESGVSLIEGMGSVFVDGHVHLLTYEKKVLAVEPEGPACRLITLPGSSWFGLVGCLGQSQGRLHYAVQQGCSGTTMQIWVLEDLEKEEWILKQRFKIEVAPQTRLLFDYAGDEFCSEIFYVVVFHPERDVVFLPVEGNKLLSYNLINSDITEVCKLDPETRPRFLVYVPTYADFLHS